MDRMPDLGRAASFGLMFLKRAWFGGRVGGSQAPTVAALLLEIYLQLDDGRLLTKKDAARILGAEHAATAKKYIDLAVGLGAITVERARSDRRVELLVPTVAGLALVEAELHRLAEEIEWANADRTRREAIEKGRPELASIADRATELFSPTVQRGMYDVALQRRIAACTETLRFFPENYMARAVRAEAYFSHQEFEKALADVNEVISRDQNPHWTFRTRVRILFKMGEYEKALPDCERALSVDPGDAFVLFYRARVLRHLHRWREALKDINAALDKRADDFQYREERAKIYEHYGDMDKALSDLMTARTDAERQGGQILNRIEAEIQRIKKTIRAKEVVSRHPR